MGSLFSALITIVTGWAGYSKARRDGTWSNRVFFLSLGGGLVISLMVILPLVMLPMESIQGHPLAFFGLMFGGIAAGVTLLVFLIKKVNAQEAAKNSRSHLPAE